MVNKTERNPCPQTLVEEGRQLRKKCILCQVVISAVRKTRPGAGDEKDNAEGEFLRVIKDCLSVNDI